MSVLSEYEEIKKAIGDEKFSNIEKFLDEHPKYYLSDVYYSKAVYNEFEKWLIEKELNQSHKKG